jgi:hypothetical protein
MLRHARFTWWVSGGQALDLFVGHPTREHADLDISILRMDAPLLHRLLLGWDLQLAHASVLIRAGYRRRARRMVSVRVTNSRDVTIGVPRQGDIDNKSVSSLTISREPLAAAHSRMRLSS